MTALLTRQDIKESTRQLVKYLDDKYGYHHWDNDEVEHDLNVIAYRKLYKRPEVKARENGIEYEANPKKDLTNLSKDEKEKYIVDEYRNGSSVVKIYHELGYAGNSAIYRVLRKYSVPIKLKNKTKMITRAMLIEASENSASITEVAKELERYSPEINGADVANLFKRFNMQKAYKEIEKRWRYRYLIENGNVERYENLTQVARHLGTTIRTLNKDAKRQNPKYKVLTWKEMRDCEDI